MKVSSNVYIVFLICVGISATLNAFALLSGVRFWNQAHFSVYRMFSVFSMAIFCLLILKGFSEGSKPLKISTFLILGIVFVVGDNMYISILSFIGLSIVFAKLNDVFKTDLSKVFVVLIWFTLLMVAIAIGLMKHLSVESTLNNFKEYERRYRLELNYDDKTVIVRKKLSLFSVIVDTHYNVDSHEMYSACVSNGSLYLKDFKKDY